MPQAPKSQSSMQSFARKTKPRAINPPAPPLHQIAPVPRAIVRPSSAARLPQSPSPNESSTADPRTQVPAPPQQSQLQPQPHQQQLQQQSTPRPRKRFRKKVNGLFGEHTDLKKRMAKLLINANSSPPFRNNYIDREGDDPALFPNLIPSSSPPRIQLPSADFIIEKLRASTPVTREIDEQIDNAQTDQEIQAMGSQDDDSFSSLGSPDFIASASRVLGSPEKLYAVRRVMGRLSPRSNQQFIEELQIGASPKSLSIKSRAAASPKYSPKIEPPRLPRVDSSEWLKQREVLFPNLAISVERSAAPAMLRRRVKRLDRGYRAIDVVRARMQGANYSDVATPPSSHRQADKSQRWPRMRGRRLDFSRGDETIRYNNSAQKRCDEERDSLEESQQFDNDSDDMTSSEGTPPKKRRLRSELREDKQSSMENPLNAGNPLAMLVEAAAEQQKQNSLQNHVRQHELTDEECPGHTRGQSSAEHSKKRRRLESQKPSAPK